MATISSPGIGSGIDVQSIVAQLVSLEKAPISQLQKQASTLQTKLSLFGSIKSQVAAMGDMATKLSSPNDWSVTSSSSSDANSVAVTSSSSALPNSYSVSVSQLARAQSTSSAALAEGLAVGSGTLTIELGSWSGTTFSGSGAAPINVTIASPANTLSEIAQQINDAGAGVKAAVLRDASGERLLLQSESTGVPNGFRISVTDDDGINADASGLSRLAYDAANTNGMTLAQSALNAQLTINGVASTSTSNQLTELLPGLSMDLLKVTSQPVEIKVSSDTASLKKNIESFVQAYNTLNSTLTNALKYDEATGKGAPLQGDATAVGLQNALRSMMRSVTSAGAYTRLSDVGIELKSGGTLAIDNTKLDSALTKLDDLSALFTVDTGDETTQGFALKIQSFSRNLMDSDGSLTTRSEGLQAAIKRNSEAQDRISDRASLVEKRLLAQYTALDTKLGTMSSLSSFVSQQLTLWNKS